MAVTNALLIGWNRAVAGREQDAVELFSVANNFYEAQKKAGRIISYDSFFLTPHGGELNGFTLLRGDPAKLDELRRSDEWIAIETRAIVLLEGIGVVPAATGENIGKLMSLYVSSLLPRR
jgi:hypothetical protein